MADIRGGSNSQDSATRDQELGQLFSGFSVASGLPFDRGAWPDSDPAADTGGAKPASPHTAAVELGAELTATLNARLSERSLDLLAALEALWALLLARYGGEQDVVFGVIANASARDVVPVRAVVDPKQAFAEFARGLAQRFAPLRAAGAGGLPQVPFESVVVEGPASTSAHASTLTRGEPALFVELERAGATTIRVRGDAVRFGVEALAELAEQLRIGLDELARAPDATVEQLSLLSPARRQDLLIHWNSGADEQAPEYCVQALFAEQVAERPAAIAVLAGDARLSYAELDAQSNALAHHLQALGVQPNDLVALCLDRSTQLVVALLGILKAGGAYLPLEMTYPKNRLEFMLADAAPRVLITQSSLLPLLPKTDIAVVLVDKDRAAISSHGTAPVRSSVTPADRAYVIYTSGSTGTPKGVDVPHRAIDRLVRHVDYVKLDPSTTILQAAPVAFDASTFEIWGSLLNGGRLSLYPDPIPTAAGLKRVIREHEVNTLWLTSALFNSVIDTDPSAFRGVHVVLTGGEALSVSHVRRALEALPDTLIIDAYGPTETTTFATCYPIPRPLDPRVRAIPIGHAIRQTSLYVLNEAREPVPVGHVGELYVGGVGVARGYLNRPELTSERFLPDPFRPGQSIYRTGDIVRRRLDRAIEYVGRADQQIKIRGFRIELGEIENALTSLPFVKNAVVIARVQQSGDKRLAAYGVLREGTTAPTNSELRRLLAERLPDYMVPSAFIWLPALPITLNGKVDHRALPDPNDDRPELSVEYLAPRNPLEQKLASSWADALGLKRIGVLDNLFDLGANSLLVVRTVGALEREHGLRVPVVKVFEYPTVARLAQQLADSGHDRVIAQAAQRAARLAGTSSGGPPPSGRAELPRIAIVGMAGRFPGAETVDALWKNLCAGLDSISQFEDSELDPFLPAELKADPAYVKARGIIADADMFDAAFFGITPKEADLMDPQQRVLLELAWETLEHGGYSPDSYAGTIGVFAGKYTNSYYAENVITRPDLIAELGEFQTSVANEKDYVATRIAHKLDLRGPALSIHTACSTSLVAVVQAVQNLQLGLCDMALAGGVAITVPIKSGYLYQEGAMLSADGHTRSFDAQAQGTVFSDGAGMLLLKREADALADGDSIYGVIRGAAMNNDGSDKASFTAPSVAGQMAVIAAAHAQAGVSPREIGYVEAHGTATPLGDPIEIEALTRAFRLGTEDSGYCALGSVKSNIGHLVIAAGAAGLIKTAFALTHKLIPPSLHFESPNPKIDFANSPFRVVTELTPWESAGPRLAGVSSFGVGGTNAHVLVEEPPLQLSAANVASEERQPQLLFLSARSESALARATERLAAACEADPKRSLADVAFTLHAGRKAFAQRRTIVADSAEDAARTLRAGKVGRSWTGKLAGSPPSVALLFPGQGAQSPGMGASFYRDYPLLRARLNAANELLRPTLGRDLTELLFAPAGSEASDLLRQTAFAQPALFALEYALAELLGSWGITPAAMIGHSVGEFVCAVLASVMTFEDALQLVAARGRLMQALPAGSMLSVRMPAAELEPTLGPSLSIASDNSLQLCVVAGPTPDIAALQQRLEAAGTTTRPLQTSHAFHSPMMDPVIEPFQKLIERVKLSAPQIRYVSTATGTWITPQEATDPAYWARHLRMPVRFRTGVGLLLQEPNTILLEAGPRGTLATLARQQIRDRKTQLCLASMGETEADARPQLLASVAQLWVRGVALSPSLHGDGRRRVALPSYPFERRRHWVDPARPTAPQPTAATPRPSPAPVSVSPAQVTAPHKSEVRMPTPARREAILVSLRDLLEEASGLELTNDDNDSAFVELGLDSLFLTQFALAIQRTLKVKITFRHLLERYPTLAELAGHIETENPAAAGGETGGSALPPSAGQPSVPAGAASMPSPEIAFLPPPTAAALAASSPVFMPQALAGAPVAVAAAHSAALQILIDQQLRLMAQQLALLSGSTALPLQVHSPPQLAAIPQQATPALTPAAASPLTLSDTARSHNGSTQRASAPPAASTKRASVPAAPAEEETGGMMKYDVKKAFGAIARISVAKGDSVSPKQRAKLDAFIRRYNDKTKGSKRFTQDNRRVVADPRAVTGFRPLVKELIYPIVVQRSLGPKLWDVDGNEYVDALNGFGLNLFGWQPPFVTKAIEEQLHLGHEIGPQAPLQADVAKLICEFTGLDRAAFCNTGSEAVMGCMRIARTVTGRQKIAIFTGSYHGIFDEVVVRGTKKLRSIPAAPGIMPSTAENVIVLDYGTEESLAILKQHASELAAIVVEPVQSRRPDFQPREFLHALRELCTREGIVYVFDEVVTGFRTGPGGAQEYFGVKADLAAYGKVVGGGLPIGVIAGRTEFMDALDGGYWQFGDDSAPPVGVTYFAGTFVRHPLALAAAKAVLTHLKQRGPSLQRDLNAKVTAYVSELNTFMASVGAPIKIKHFASLWKTFYTEDQAFGDLLFFMMRDRGVHIYDGFPCFFTTSHTDDEFAQMAKAYRESVLEMQESGFFPERETPAIDANAPPAAGARLGRDPSGNPAWYVPHPSQPGKYVKLESTN